MWNRLDKLFAKVRKSVSKSAKGKMYLFKWQNVFENFGPKGIKKTEENTNQNNN